MKQQRNVRITLLTDRLCQHPFRELLLFLLAVFTLLVFWINAYYYERTQNIRREANACFSDGIERNCFLEIFQTPPDMDIVEFLNLRDSINGIQGVKLAGCFSETDFVTEENYTSEELMLIQREVNAQHGGATLNNGFRFQEIDVDLWSVFSFHLVLGEEPTKWELKENEKLLYLGSEYMGKVTPGQRFVYTGPNGLQSYVIGGILQEGTKIIREWTTDWDPVSDYTISEVLDNKVLYIKGLENSDQSDRISMSPDSWYITIQKEAEVDETLTLIRETLTDYGITKYRMAFLSEYIERFDESTEGIRKLLLDILLVVAFTEVVVMITMRITEMLGNARDYGVLYACGVTRRELQMQHFVHLFMCQTAAWAVSFSIANLVIKNKFNEWQIGEIAKTISNKYVAPKAFLLSVLIACIQALSIGVFLHRRTPMEWYRKKV